MITRQKLIDQIEKYKPYNEQEEKDKILILDWIRNNENAISMEDMQMLRRIYCPLLSEK